MTTAKENHGKTFMQGAILALCFDRHHYLRCRRLQREWRLAGYPDKAREYRVYANDEIRKTLSRPGVFRCHGCGSYLVQFDIGFRGYSPWRQDRDGKLIRGERFEECDAEDGIATYCHSCGQEAWIESTGLSAISAEFSRVFWGI